MQVLKKNHNTFRHSEGYWDQLKMKIFKIIYTIHICKQDPFIVSFGIFFFHTSLFSLKTSPVSRPERKFRNRLSTSRNHTKRSSHINSKRGHLSVPSTMAWTSLDCQSCTLCAATTVKTLCIEAWCRNFFNSFGKKKLRNLGKLTNKIIEVSQV